MSVFNPKISVMIVTYNQVDLIGETIESVVSQDYGNLEVIVADDASTDGTQAVIAEYEKKYPGVVKPVFNPVNLNVTGNSNAAFHACTGELIAVLGGDDIFLPGKLAAQVKDFADPAVVMSYHPVEIFIHETGEVVFTTNTTKKERIKDVYDVIAKCGIPGASSLMVRRSACPDYGFDARFPVISDWIFCIEVALKGAIKELPGVFGKYRKHGLGVTNRSFELLGEALRTLEIISARYPHDEKIQRACRTGANRFLLGELYRQVVKRDGGKVRQLTPYFLAWNVGARRVMMAIALQVLASPLVIALLVGPLQRLKPILKRNA
ncbi:glycosyltransferase family 2 protein [Comamonas terrigena]|uniref:glycosyltransferase family 2 protein n=1 Tax=Comamonas terrigena TaxID=32013 RepID=UPI002448A3EF|nr:glycosyltransferase [Comamonas terrigena]MDH1700763.1 glycosyltransferase [Comamonas terrigena]